MFQGVWSDEPLTWDSYIENLMFPWTNVPQVRMLTGRSPVPEYSRSSIASSLTWAYTMWQLGLSTRALAGHIIARQYTTPVTLPLAIAVGATAGWIATADQHGAVTPGVASGFGMPMGPTTGGSLDNPLGLTSQSISQWASNMVPGFLR